MSEQMNSSRQPDLKAPQLSDSGHDAVVPRRRLRRWPLAIVLAVVAVTWLVADALGRDAGGKGGGRGKNGQPVSVAVASVRKGDLDLYVDALGTATPLSSVLVRSRVDGELVRVHFREGQQVRAGDLLAEIDPRPFEVLLAQARGKLARDEALLRNARTDLERYQTLWSQDSISRQELDTQQALVQQYEGAVLGDRGEVQSAELQLSYAKITAPVSGRVGLRQVDPGNIVHASDTRGLLLITQVDPIAVVFAVPENRINAIARRSAEAPLVVEAWDRERVQKLAVGHLESLDNQIDIATGTVKLKAVFANNAANGTDAPINSGTSKTEGNVIAGALFPNQFVNVRLRVDTVRDVVLIPLDAVQRGSKGAFVYALQPDDTVRQQSVDIGEAAGSSAVVTRGIEPGARIVVDGIDKLRDNAKVAVIESRFEPATPALTDNRPQPKAWPSP